MITAVSMNPSIDRTLTVDGFIPGGLNRIVAKRDVAAGKGINVALTVSELGLDSECVGFMYRDGASQFEKRLMLNSTPYDFIWCEGSVRTNIKVFDRSTGTITELNESGMNVTEENLSKMVDLVVRHAENSDYLILSGSLPPGCPQDYYRTLIHAVEGLGCRCVLDADGERLKFGLEARPFMIKPNRYELETMIGRPLDGITDIREAALRYIDMGVQVVAAGRHHRHTGGRAALHRHGRAGRQRVPGCGRRADHRRERDALRAPNEHRGQGHRRRGRRDGRRPGGGFHGGLGS